MSWNGKNHQSDGLIEQGFTLHVDGHEVPGVYWEPQDGADKLVMLGHGGTTHKKIDYILALAGLLAKQGIASVAIDGPGHGDRVERWEHEPDRFQEMWRNGGGTETVLTDWSAALDFIETERSARPTGWWGLSMGTMMGLPVTATESRIRVAVLGLMGTWGPNEDDLKRLATQVSCPVRFLVQWDDEIVPRDACIELFGMLGTPRKTMHVNPGLHSAVPQFEIAGSVDYLATQLGK
ncbi:MAG: alpha/beta fold hydrolase [Pseudomonadota bacterium]